MCDSPLLLISHAGRAKPTEAFSFECEVTAHQTAAVSTTAIVGVAADQLTYKSGTLLFHNGDVEQPVLTGSGWSKFALGCAPEISWLSINSENGHLTYASDTSSQGAWGGMSNRKWFIFTNPKVHSENPHQIEKGVSPLVRSDHHS